jgi:hypothetical protein
MSKITRETVESLSEKLEAFAVSLPEEERTVLMTALANSVKEEKGGRSSMDLAHALSSSIGLKTGSSISNRELSASRSFIKLDITRVIDASKV